MSNKLTDLQLKQKELEKKQAKLDAKRAKLEKQIEIERKQLKRQEIVQQQNQQTTFIKLTFGVPHGYRDTDGEFVKSTRTVESGTFSSEEKAAKFFYNLVTANQWNKFDKPEEFFSYEDCLEIIQLRQSGLIGGVENAWERLLTITDIVANDPVYGETR